VKAKDRLLSWKQEPPKTPSERATARLLEDLRAAPTLSPEAFARIERRLREGTHRPKRKVLSLAGPWMPAIAGAAALVLVIGAFTLAIFQRKTVLESSADRIALVAPAANPPDERRAMDKSRPETAEKVEPPVQLAERERFAQPPPAAGVSAKKSSNVTREERVRPADLGSRAAAGAASGAPAADADHASLGARAMKAPSESATPEPATAVTPALIDRAEQLARMGRCREAIAAFTGAMSTGQDPVVERALYGRARCLLTLGEASQAQTDLRAYLARFPTGRFASEAQDLLR
jgi:hypothetical protein